MKPTDPPSTAVFTGWPDLASAELGGRTLLCSDAFFAGPDRLVHADEPVWDADRYTDRGKWMDGWEPRRRRAPGHDWCIVALGVPGDLVGVDIDTRFFLGNHAPYGRLDATVAPADATGEWLRDHAEWTCVLDQVPLGRGGHNVLGLRPFNGATHVRLSIYPAGGVARLRVHGRPRPAPTTSRVDLASVLRGGRALACSDMFFSRMDNLLLPSEAPHMGHGWETRRSPLPRTDWVILALGEPGQLDEIVLDTKHFKGNYPTGARVEALCWPGASPHALSSSTDWQDITGEVPLGPDQPHHIPVTQPGPWTHLRMVILSDGGVSRLRAWGTPTELETTDPVLQWLNQAPEEPATAALTRCCGASRWVEDMLAARPFVGRTHLHGVARELWWHRDERDWREAFTHHPAIGADPAALRARFGATATWSAGEQSGVHGANEQTLDALAKGNADYQARHGFIFIVCASGLTAEQMLAHLQRRLPNPLAEELRIAAGEQARITALRLDKLEIPS